MRKRCTGKCPGTPEPGHTIQIFERRGSAVKITIRNIPADVCPVCHDAFVSRETAQMLDHLLKPFHGTNGAIPTLPTSEVTIDFQVATRHLKVA